MVNQFSLTKEANKAMEKAYQTIKTNLGQFNANRVAPKMISKIQVDYHGVLVPLEQVANISAQSASSLTIKPWEKSLLIKIESAVSQENEHGFSIKNKGEYIEAHRPPLTAENRKVLVAQVKQKIEKSKVSLRKIRQDIMKKIKTIKSEDEAKRVENELEKVTQEWHNKIETLQKEKEQELMTI